MQAASGTSPCRIIRAPTCSSVARMRAAMSRNALSLRLRNKSSDERNWMCWEAEADMRSSTKGRTGAAYHSSVLRRGLAAGKGITVSRFRCLGKVGSRASASRFQKAREIPRSVHHRRPTEGVRTQEIDRHPLILSAQRFNFPNVAFAIRWPRRHIHGQHLLRTKRGAERHLCGEAIHHASVLQSVLAPGDVASPRGKHAWQRRGTPYCVLQAKLRCLAVAD